VYADINTGNTRHPQRSLHHAAALLLAQLGQETLYRLVNRLRLF
jgi:hypothetical protein